MTHFFKTQVGRLRLIGYLEGLSLIVLLFVAVPLKHFYNEPGLVSNMGPIHGSLFLLFVYTAISVGVKRPGRYSLPVSFLSEHSTLTNTCSKTLSAIEK
jgi:integral membrane protein